MAGVAFLFGGPGLAEPDMGRELYNKSPLIRESVDKADKLLLAMGGVKPTKACFAADRALIARPSVAAPAVLAFSHGVARTLKARRIFPAAAAGFGWGELVALGALGSLDYGAALKLLYELGLRQEEAFARRPWQALAVQGLGLEALAESALDLSEPPHCAAMFSAEHFVLTGSREDLLKLRASAQGARGVKLSEVEPGWQWPHPSCADAAAACAGALASLGAEALPCPLQGAAEAEPVRRPLDWAERARACACEPLDWSAACRRLLAQGVDTAVEIGPGQSLGVGLKRLNTGLRALATEDFGLLAQALKLAV